MLRARGAAGWALIVLVWTAPLVAADGWHLAGWSGRAIVTIAKPLSVAGVDTAAVRIVHQGRARPDGADFRVLDAVGKPVNIVMGFADPTITLDQLGEIGVRRVSIGAGLSRVALSAMMGAAREMKAGRFGFIEDMIGIGELRVAFGD